METFAAVIDFREIELRFAYGGVVSWVGMSVGDKVGRGQVLARLDEQVLKKKHQRELVGYEKIRADFERLKKKLESSDEPDKKYLMDRAQADLEAAVLAVEISQYQLEQAELRTPVDGMIADDGGLAAGINISPASFSVRVIVSGSLQVRANVAQEKLALIGKDQYIEFVPVGSGRVCKGRIKAVLPGARARGGDFVLIGVLEEVESVFAGMKGELRVYPEK